MKTLIEELKNYCRLKKKYYDKEIVDLINQRKIYEDPTPKAAYLAAMSEKDQDRLGKYGSRELLDEIMTKLRATVTLQEAQKKRKEKIEFYNDNINYKTKQCNVLSQMSCNFRIDGKVEAFDDLLNVLINLKLFCLDCNKDVDTFTVLMGKAIYATAQKIIKNKEISDEDTYEAKLIKLGECFDANGVYNGKLAPKEFMLSFTSIFGPVLVETESFVFTPKDGTKSLNTRHAINGRDLSEYIIAKHSEILKRQAETNEIIFESPKIPSKIVFNPLISAARTEVRNYYQNGEIVNICEDINYLNELLQKAGYQSSEIKAIIKKMKERIKGEKVAITKEEIQIDDRIFNESNLEIYQSSLKDLKSRSVYDEEYFVIKHHVDELSAIYDLAKLPEALGISDEEAALLNNEVSVNIWPLISIISLSSDESKESNLYYLLDSNGVGEVIHDIEALDKQSKLLVPKLLKKLSDGNTMRLGTFKYRGKLNINYISHGKLNVFYLELIPNKYLVLGISKQLEEAYGPIASRLGNDYEKKIERFKMIISKEISDSQFMDASKSINEYIFERIDVPSFGLKLD